jgi:hypothetical protein
MNIFMTRLIATALLACDVLTSWAAPVDVIDTDGVYVVADKGYVEVGSYTHDDRYVDFNFLNEVPFVKRAGQSLKLVVHKKDFSANDMALELRPIDTVVDVHEIKFSAKPLSQANMYEVTVDTPVKDGTMLHVRSGYFFSNGFGVIMLGDTQGELVKFFSQKQLANASIVKQYLDDALVAFPTNAGLKGLTEYWTQAAKTEKDRKGYTYVEEKWQQYLHAEKISLKARYLNDVIGEINGYLNDHPDGYKADEAKQRKLEAEEKLKEYEKML